MRTILINYYYNEEGNLVIPGYLEVDQYGVYPVDNYEDGINAIYLFTKDFINVFSEYITEKEEKELYQKLNDAYNDLTEKEFYKVVEEIFERFTKIQDEEIRFSIVNDKRITTKITTLYKGHRESGYILDRLGEKKSNVRPMNEYVKLEDGVMRKFNYEMESMYDFYSRNLEDSEKYNLGLVDERQDINASFINRLRVNQNKVIALGMASIILACGVGYIKTNNDRKKHVYEPNKNKVTVEATMQPVADYETENEIVYVEPTETPALHYEVVEDKDIVAQSYEDGKVVPHSINDAAYSDITNMVYISNDNIYDLSSYIFDNSYHSELTKTGFTIDFEKYFTNCTDYEQAFIKHFSYYRNDIIYQGYRLGNYDEARRVNMHAASEVIKYVINNEPFVVEINGETVEGHFSDLSEDVRNIIESMSWNFCTFLGTDTAIYEGQEYTTDMIAYDLYSINTKVLSE